MTDTEQAVVPGTRPGSIAGGLDGARDGRAGCEMPAVPAPQRRFGQDAESGAEKPGSGLAGLAEDAAAGLRSSTAAPGPDAGDGLDRAHAAVATLVEGVVATNVRLAEELLRCAGPDDVAELQRRFLREYFDALAKGGALLLAAAGQAAEKSQRPPGPQME